ncbi:MAG: hypothetical protein LBQ94_07135 [Treponema sp.]|nr:hypothetical protein [Treponema sp.]
MEIAKIDARIKLPIPPNMEVTPRSTPVVWFGNYEQAKACTISINPSDKEFNPHTKLCTRDELKKSDNDPLDDKDAIKVRERCNNYFGGNPYRIWFDAFEHFLRNFGNYSYYDGTCVHCDMVQWATTPTWSKLPEAVREKHIKNDLPILKHLLEKDFEAMFLNGRSVVESISGHLNIKLGVKTVSINDKKINIYTGEYNRAKVIGWNQHLQSSVFNNFDNIVILCDLIKRESSQS